MTEVICLGGPLHGQFVERAETLTVSYTSPADRGLTASYDRVAAQREELILQGADPGELIEPRKPGRTVTYHLRSIEIVGWRLALNCLTTWEPFASAPDGCVMPGYVHGVPAEHEPDRNAPEAVCRCALTDLAAALRKVTGRGRSYCHLDHCPMHGPFREKGKTDAHGG
jgi:hypothetical protein